MPLVWFRRFISGYFGFLGDKGVRVGFFCWFMDILYIQSHRETSDKQKIYGRVESAVLKRFKNKNVTIILLVQARRDFDRHSDIDIGISPKNNDCKNDSAISQSKIPGFEIQKTSIECSLFWYIFLFA